MREGYYLSTFLCINEMQNLLNIKLRHDHTVALWKLEKKELRLVRYWELERISGMKQHNKALFHKEKFDELVGYLLKDEGLDIKDIIEIWGTKELESNIRYRKRFEGDIAFHSMAHLFTAIFFSNKAPFQDTILGMALDAGPDSMFEEDAYEKKYYVGCVIKNGKINYFAIESPARLWSYSYKKFGLREGTLMALCSAADTACYVPETKMNEWRLYQFYDEKSRINSQNLVDDICTYVFKLRKNDIGILCSEFDSRFSDTENKLSMVMKIILELSLDIVSKNIDRICNEFDINPCDTILAMAGGFALNCPTNSAILSKYGFKNYQIPPCTNDTGIAMGVGIAAFFDLLERQLITLDIRTAYYGQNIGYIDEACGKFANCILEVRAADSEEFAKLLIDGNILVWINDKAEIGPRALGNRSLLADARNLASKEKLNEIKKRQWWRPVAPIIMNEYGESYFEQYIPSPNMLLNFKVKPDKIKLIPSIVHHDFTARVQSVTYESNDVLYNLLKSFYEETGVPILCNTSLNDAGEPIINLVDEAIEFALHKGLKYICINGCFLIRLKTCDELRNAFPPLRKECFFHAPDQINIEKYLNDHNPYDLSPEELTTYYDNPNKFYGLELSEERVANHIKEVTAEYQKKYPNDLRR